MQARTPPIVGVTNPGDSPQPQPRGQSPGEGHHSHRARGGVGSGEARCVPARAWRIRPGTPGTHAGDQMRGMVPAHFQCRRLVRRWGRTHRRRLRAVTHIKGLRGPAGGRIHAQGHAGQSSPPVRNLVALADADPVGGLGLRPLEATSVTALLRTSTCSMIIALATSSVVVVRWLLAIVMSVRPSIWWSTDEPGTAVAGADSRCVPRNAKRGLCGR